MWTRLATDEGIVELDATPIRLSATPAVIQTPGPLLDEHRGAIRQLLTAIGPKDNENRR
jgi:hypothetical protein